LTGTVQRNYSHVRGQIRSTSGDYRIAAVTIRVFIAAPVRLYRDGLAELLRREQGMAVVGVAGESGRTLADVRALGPDVVLLDPGLPEGVEAVRELTGSVGVKVIALACPETEQAVVACAEAGVSGFVTPDHSLADLVAAIRSPARGESLVSPRTAATLIRRVNALAVERAPSATEPRFTPREVEVVQLIEEGLSNKQIAHRLAIELPTVKQHVHHILEKLEVGRRGEAVARLRRRGHPR
jgi:two-component system, NarL family, nitrate/nitrite response regulator NarL